MAENYSIWDGWELPLPEESRQAVHITDEPLTLENFQNAVELLRHGGSIGGRVRQETGTDNPEKYSEGLKRKAETMYKYKFRFKGGGKRIENMNFKFHCFVADTEAVEHHLFEAKNKGLVVSDTDEASPTFENKVYVSAMPIVKVFSATSGFGVPKEYFSFFFLINPGSKKMVKIRPLGFDNSVAVKQLSDWCFIAPGRFLRREEIQKFFGSTSDTWKFYQRQSFISKRRLLEMVIVGDNKNTYSGEVNSNEEQVRMVRLD